MKALLLYPDGDLETEARIPWNAQALIEDLALNTLFDAMSEGDSFLLEVVRKVILSSVSNPISTILYRQDILKDCLNNSSLIMEMYAITIEAIEKEKKIYWGIFSRYPSAILDRSIEVMQLFVGLMTRLRKIAEENGERFNSAGFTNFFKMLRLELSESYMDSIQDHLRDLKFPYGLLITAKLGKGNKGTQYTLRKMDKPNRNWWDWLFKEKPDIYSYTIADRDDAGFRALTDLKDRGINEIANALAQSCDHILSFFKMVKTELAFYIGCMNLHKRLISLGEPFTFPVPIGFDENQHIFCELYDICLAIKSNQKVVGNDLAADHQNLFVITGANQGGKSTFLRSIGLAQLMMQSGMFVPAKSFTANLCDGVFTHFKREEDSSMSSGKLDEELSRMNEIVNQITPNPMVLFNESFAATNEREGSEIARQITLALMEKGVTVFFVSHLFAFTHGLFERQLNQALFLRAEREEGGKRTYRLTIGEPLPTSFGKDLFFQLSATQT